MEGDTARTAEPNWPENHSIPYGIMLNNETGEVGQERPISAQGLAGHHSASDEQLQRASLVLHILLFVVVVVVVVVLLLVLFSLSVQLNYLYLNQSLSHFFPNVRVVFSCLPN